MEELEIPPLTIDDRKQPLPRKRSFVCTACGYGIVRAMPPGQCPMCQAEQAWVAAPSLSPTLLLAG